MKNKIKTSVAALLLSSVVWASDPSPTEKYDLWKLREELPKRVLTDGELNALLDAGWEKLYSFGAWFASGRPGPEYQQQFNSNLQTQALLRKLAAPAPPAKEEKHPITELANDAFEVGLKIGFNAALRGATQNDIEFLAQTKRARGAAAAMKWFADHPALDGPAKIQSLAAELCSLRGHRWKPGCAMEGCLVMHSGPIRHCVVCEKTETQEVGEWK